MTNYYSPKEMAQHFAFSAEQKIQLPVVKFLIVAILGGAFIAFGGLLSVMVAGGIPEIGTENPGLVKFIAGALFPIGLIMVSMTGADLFTSDCAAFTFGLLGRNCNWGTFTKFLILSFLLNFIGAQLVAFVLTWNVGLLSHNPWQDYLHHYAEAKINQSFITVLIKGIGANWLVCMGMFMGYAAKDIAGKAIGIWIPVMLFVTLGYENSIANMFFIPSAIYSGADITWSAFLLQNLLPATIGNFIGGAFLVGCVYWFLYLKE